MSILPDSVEKLIEEFKRLPGVGQKSASRMAYHYMKRSKEDLQKVAKTFQVLSEGIEKCRNCCIYADKDFCSICNDPQRIDEQILVVEEPLDAVAFEETGEYKGKYHILDGVISPVNGIGPEDLNIASLEKRVAKLIKNGNVEIILGTNPTLEGEATSTYIKNCLQNFEDSLKITVLARGLPTGADLDYADQRTLQKALEGRVGF